ncbi:lysophospholipid acyltransferase family protein [Persicobacter sp. CCB-QB2]|uniref:lysophospholipid acyltransferase family protein n=1 Tax=Persicobacter sp. CCB-QB2 TaxID=1561025 RepID=UPI0009E20E96|nr:lysophospholipid acyltransferase family protein [Persicobacter sp. CCB-QB2]
MMIAVSIFQSTLKRIPMAFYYLLADVLYLIGYRLFGYRKAVVQKNLKAAFPEMTEEARLSIEKKFYRHLSDYLVETSAMSRLTAHELKKRFQFNNLELLHEYYRKHKNVILASGHQSNWEWMALLPLYVGQEAKAVYRKQSSPFADEVIYANRSKFGMELVQDKDLLPYLKHQDNKQPQLLYMLCDQRPSESKKPTILEFMHQPVAAFQGLNFISRMFDYEVIYADIRKTARGKYEVTFKALQPSAEESVVECFFKQLERSIEAQPHTYLWSHNRWKNPPATPLALKKNQAAKGIPLFRLNQLEIA